MKQEISTLIYDTLKGIVEIYPVLADVEDSKQRKRLRKCMIPEFLLLRILMRLPGKLYIKWKRR